jgi:hypothetical protein
MVWLCVWALCCGALASGGLVGCKPSEDGRARLDMVTPQPAAQRAEFALFGAGLGEWNLFENQVLINGECADVLAWSDTRILAVVPSGVGVGVRSLEVRTANGQRLTSALTIQGPDRPREPKYCNSIGGPVITDPDALDPSDGDDTVDVFDPSDVEDADDTFNPPDTPDTFNPPDTPDLPDIPTTRPYFFVLLYDEGPVIEQSAGADIDALILRKPNGATFYANEVLEYATLSRHPFTDAFAAIGPPDAFWAYPDTSQCFTEKGFVSLGGVGSYLIVEFPAPIEAGDVLEVLEVGACVDDAGRVATPEPFFVAVAATPNLDDSWVPLFFSEGGASAFDVPPLP